MITPQNLPQQLLTILVVILGTQLTRWIIFILFPEGKRTPAFLQYLGKYLPLAIFGTLIIYCYKSVNVFNLYASIPMFIAGIIVVVLHLWKNNMVLSILTGTIIYILLVNLVFV